MSTIQTPDQDILHACRKLLWYYLIDTDFEYAGLTEKERSLVDEPAFNNLVRWVKDGMTL